MKIILDRREITLSDTCTAIIDRQRPSEIEIRVKDDELVTEDDLWSLLRSSQMSISDVTHVIGRGILVANHGGVSLEKLRSVEWSMVVNSQTERRGAQRLLALTRVAGSLKVNGPIVIPNLESVGRRCELQNGASMDRLRSVGLDFVTSGVGTSARTLVSVGGMAILEAGSAPELRFVGGEIAYSMSTLNAYKRQEHPFCHPSCKDGMGAEAALGAGAKWVENRSLIGDEFDDAASQLNESSPADQSLV